MHIITWKENGKNHELRSDVIQEVLEMTRHLKEENILFKHVFEEQHMHKIFWKTSRGEEKVFICKCDKQTLQWIRCLDKGNVEYTYRYDRENKQQE